MNKPIFTLGGLLLVMVLFACGGGGGGGGEIIAASQEVTVTISGQGTEIYGGADLTITLPAGFVLPVDGEGKPTVDALTFLLAGENILTGAVYIPETAVANGRLDIVITKPDGFPADTPLVRLSHIYPAGAALPDEDEFLVTLKLHTIPDATKVDATPQISVSRIAVPVP